MSEDMPDPAPLSPESELEEHLAAAQNGELSTVDFLGHLSRGRVHILINQSVAEEEDPEDVEPLVLLGPEDTPMLAAFTLAGRGATMTRQFPEFGFTLEVDFTWVVANCGEGMGIVVNPGWDIGATLPPEAIGRMRPE